MSRGLRAQVLRSEKSEDYQHFLGLSSSSTGRAARVQIPVPVQNINVCGVYLIYTRQRAWPDALKKKMQDH